MKWFKKKELESNLKVKEDIDDKIKAHETMLNSIFCVMKNKISEIDLQAYMIKHYVECEKCGCLLKKDNAYRGKPKQVIKNSSGLIGSFTEMIKSIGICNDIITGKDRGDKNEYELQEVYYCKVHKPKQQ
jgi:hypothetical protein